MTNRTEMTGRPRALVPVLVGVTLVISVISSLGAPLIPAVAESLDVSLDSAQWSLTAAVLAATVASPVLGRLGDGPHRRTAIVGALAVVFVGSLIAGLAESLGVLVVGRAMQGVGLGLAPVLMATARDLLPAERSGAVIGLLSVSGAAGVGAGYPISGLVTTWFSVHYAFGLGAVMSAIAIVAVLLVVPVTAGSGRTTLDVRGATVMGVGLIALLLGVGQGSTWGWTSGTVIGLFVAAAILLATWVRLQLATPMPLVDLRQLRHRAVAGADLAAFLLGVAMYTFLTIVTSFVQMPFSFEATALVAGLCLVPFSVASLLASRIMIGVMRRLGARFVLVVGSLIIAAAGGFFALVHAALWEAFATMALIGLGFGFTFAAIPGIIARAVPESETGSAMGFYQVVRAIGFAIGSALTASILAAHDSSEQGFVVALWVGAAVCVVAAIACGAFAPGGTAALSEPLERRARDDAELASAGLIDID